MKIFIAIACFIIAASFFLMLPKHVYANTLSLIPDKTKVLKDETITVKVQLETTEEVNTVQANISYAEDRLKLLSTNTANSAFDVDGPSTAGSGNIQIIRGVIENGIKGTKLVAELKFRAEKDTGTAAITLKTDSLALRGSDQKNVLTISRGTTITFTKPDVTQPSSSPTKKDTIAPTISEITTAQVSTNSATIQWRTDEDATTVVQYGVDKNYGLTSQKKEMVKNHSITLDPAKLEPNATYNYRVKSADEYGNEATGSNKIFITASSIEPTATPTPTKSPAPTLPKPAVKDTDNGKGYIIGGIATLLLVLVIVAIKNHNHTPPKNTPKQKIESPVKPVVVNLTEEPKPEVPPPQPPHTQVFHKPDHHEPEIAKTHITPLIKVHEEHNKSYEIKYKTYHADK